jgi:putative NADPH-quinone reductase
MGKRIAVILGHPDPDPARFGRALAAAYTRGAEAAGHELRTIPVATLEFPLLRRAQGLAGGNGETRPRGPLNGEPA